MRSSKPCLSRRVRRQYLNVLNNDGARWYMPWGWGGWGVSSSGNPNGLAAYFFAKQWRGRDGVDLVRLQTIVCRSKCADAAYMWARDIPGANVRRLQKIVASFGSLDTIKAFARNVSGADREFLEGLCVVKEVLGT